MTRKLDRLTARLLGFFGRTDLPSANVSLETYLNRLQLALQAAAFTA
jgi:hypothetical protein